MIWRIVNLGITLKKNINMSKGIDLEPNWVPASKYWLIIDGFPTGISQLFVFRDNEIGNAFWSTTGWTKREDIFVYSINT